MREITAPEAKSVGGGINVPIVLRCAGGAVVGSVSAGSAAWVGGSNWGGVIFGGVLGAGIGCYSGVVGGLSGIASVLKAGKAGLLTGAGTAMADHAWGEP